MKQEDEPVVAVNQPPGRIRLVSPDLRDPLTPPLPADDFFSDVGDPAWMARLSLPLAADYHDNVFIPNGPPSPEGDFLPRDVLDSSSFSTFGKYLTQSGEDGDGGKGRFRLNSSVSLSPPGKTPEKDGPLGGALLSEVSTLFEMLMTQKADAHPGSPPPDMLYRLSAAYHRSLGLDGSVTTAAANAPRCGPAHRAAPLTWNTGKD